MLRTAASFIFVAVLASCATTPVDNAPSVDSRFNLAYEIDNRRRIDLSSVFDDGRRTFLQFGVEAAQTPLVIRLPQGSAVMFTRLGNYWVAEGVYRQLTVRIGDTTVNVMNLGPESRDETIMRSAPATPATQPASITKSVERGPAAVVPDKVVVTFENRQARLSPKAHSQINTFAQLAHKAPLILVRGFTSTVQSSPQSKALALERALQVRHALIDAGIDARRVRIFYSSFCCRKPQGGATVPAPKDYQRAEITLPVPGSSPEPPALVRSPALLKTP